MSDWNDEEVWEDLGGDILKKMQDKLLEIVTKLERQHKELKEDYNKFVHETIQVIKKFSLKFWNI
jgi:hypothetical protein